MNDDSPHSWNYDDDELLRQLRELADELGETPTATQMDKHDDYPSRSAYRRKFGSWNAALREAGLDPNQEYYDDDELLRYLQELAEELGETPTAKQMDEHDDYPSRSAYRRKFGSWNEALIEAGLEPNK